MFIDSIQQSPIDLDFSSESPPPLSHVSEENPLSPPIETPLISSCVTSRMKFWRIKDWIHQLVEPLVSVEGNVSVGRYSDGMSVEVTNRITGCCIRVIGADIFWDNCCARIHEEDKIEQSVKELYVRGQVLIEQWRSRIVRLTLDTEDVECSLMDDMYPPRTFLAEYKLSVLLRSIKLHEGILCISTVTRTITVPVSLLEDEPDGKVSELLCSAAPELSVIDMDNVLEQFIQLRRMCIDEDKRMFEQERVIRGESGDFSNIDITVGGG
jgi:hypothetical protein